jgi:hypothetical protein
MTIILSLLFSFVLIGIGWVLTSTQKADRNALLRKTRLEVAPFGWTECFMF